MSPPSSSRGSRSSSKTHGRRTMCFCGKRPVLRTSSTAENPGRRFWGCVNYQNRSEKNVKAKGHNPQIQRLKKKTSVLKKNLQKAKRKFALALAVGVLGWITADLFLYD
ncbi:hypothetical protein Ahy_A10g050677 [Arachis hypogaea]|uniref:Zinc finger GRF-type domain-containing protein n=1 Tax=Arachis hypogaea TaxID=3818 RepID=A0A445BA20_ARAHY|nr:hypothetical protein Ahy_A10g050677 [Arachis hypogaea]